MPIMDIPPEMLEHIYDEQTTDILNEFKNYIKEYLVKNKNKKQNDPVLQNIDNSTEYNEIEAFLKQNGVEGDELNKVYREFIERE
jgi:ABC-type sulfate transport system substrate-binding protein